MADRRIPFRFAPLHRCAHYPLDDEMTDYNKTDELTNLDERKYTHSYGEVKWGLVLGLFVAGAYAINLSPSEFHNTSKIYLALTIAVFVAIGAIFGEKFMEKLAERVKWFL